MLDLLEFADQPAEGISNPLARPRDQGQILEMAVRAGIEPASASSKAAIREATCEIEKDRCAPLDSQSLLELGYLVGAWLKLPREIRFAMLALARASKGGPL